MEYNRNAAAAYARRWAYRRNPQFYDFSDLGGDCTNFASQCIYAGAGGMNYTPTYGWYYRSLNDRAPAWTGVEQLYNFLVNNRGAGPQGQVVPLNRIQVGDIIQLRFAGANYFGHSPVVIDVGSRTPATIQIAAHSYDCSCRQLNTYNIAAIRPIHIYNVGQ